jgi:outer membrane lipoprotein-sorting protein
MNTKSLAAILIAAAMPAFPETADAVLARMNNESSNFHQISAKLTKSDYTAVLNDAQSESGQMWLKRNGSDIVMRTDFSAPQSRSVAVGRGTAQIYYPKINTVQIYDMGKAGVLVDQFLVLGFGSSGKDISKNYIVKLAGEETINGEKASRLELTPKSPKVSDQISKVELWIPLNAGHPIQQRVTQPGGDYYLFAYSDIKLNPGLPESAFRLELPAGVKKEYPQK